MVKHSSTGWKTFKFFQLQRGGALAPIKPSLAMGLVMDSFAGPLRGERGGPGVVENKNKLACKACGKFSVVNYLFIMGVAIQIF